MPQQMLGLLVDALMAQSCKAKTETPPECRPSCSCLPSSVWSLLHPRCCTRSRCLTGGGCIAAPKAVQGNIAFGAVLAYVAAYSLGSGPIPWIYLPEILPDAVKGPAAAACTCLNWAANLAIGISFPLLLKALHITGAYLIFAVVNGLGVVFIWMLVIETKQRSLAEIAAELVVPD